MLTYQYQWVLYQPDLFCGEFVIVGFVLWCPETAELKHYLTPSIQRASHFFAKGPIHAKQTLNSGLKNLDIALHDLQAQSLSQAQDLSTLMQSVLPSNENALQMGAVKKAITQTVASAYEKLLHQVEKYSLQENRSDRLSESDLQKSLLQSFKKHSVSQYLKPYQVTSKTGLQLDFDQSWVNGRVNLYQPVSFDLKREINVIRKMYEVKGKIDMLDDDANGQSFTVHLISAPPAHLNLPAQAQLSQTIQQTLKASSDNLKRVSVQLYSPDEIEQLAKDTQQQILTYLK